MSAGRGWGRPGAGVTYWPLSSIWQQQRFALAPVIMQCNMGFKNQFGSRHWPRSPVLDKMDMATVTGTGSRAQGRCVTEISLIQRSFTRSTNLTLGNTFLG